MAGDWLKVEIITPDKPEVSNIAHRLSITPEEAFGRLFRVWVWCQNVSVNGHVRVRDLSPIDRAAGLPKFGQAMAEEHWVLEAEGGFTIPKWDRHLSKGAKKRALDMERKRRERAENPSEDHPPPKRTRGRGRDSSSPTEKKSMRAPPREPKCRMPDSLTATDAEMLDYVREKGYPEGQLGLYLEVFREAVLKGDLMYHGLVGWRAAFKKCIREDWGKIRAHPHTKESRQVQWLNELTGHGGVKPPKEEGDAIEGTSERVS